MAKPNFDTHAAFVSLVNAGIPEKQAEQILDTLKDSQSDLATKQDIKDVMARFDIVSLQIKALFVMNAGIIAAIVWFGNAFLDKIK